MPDPIPLTGRIEPAPKFMKLSPNATKELRQWLNGQHDAVTHVTGNLKQDIDEAMAKHNEPPRGWLQKIAKKLDTEPAGNLPRELESEQKHLRSISDAQLDLQNGRVDRVELLLEVSLDQAQMVLSMSLQDEDPHYASLRKIQSAAMGEIGLLKHINPKRAESFRRWFNSTGKRASTSYFDR